MKVEFDFKRAEKLILEHKVDEMSTSEYTHLKHIVISLRIIILLKKDLLLKNTVG